MLICQLTHGTLLLFEKYAIIYSNTYSVRKRIFLYLNKLHLFFPQTVSDPALLRALSTGPTFHKERKKSSLWD